MEQRLLDQAYEAGRDASRNRRALSECPTFAIGEQGRPWRERWRKGWHDGEVAATVCLLAAIPDLVAWSLRQVDDEGGPGELGAILSRAGVR